MDQATAPLVVALISAATTSLGWIALHYLTRRREIESREFTQKREIESREFVARRDEEGRAAARSQSDRTRRLELRLNHCERQINEFYAPIYSNIQLIWNIWRIGERFNYELSDTDNDLPIDEVRSRIGDRLVSDYYKPLHEEIRSIIKAKMFLVNGSDLPDSFERYLMHSVMEDVQRRIREADGLSTSSVMGEPWEMRFPEDVKSGLDGAMREYDDILRELAPPHIPADPEATHGPQEHSASAED